MMKRRDVLINESIVRLIIESLGFMMDPFC